MSLLITPETASDEHSIKEVLVCWSDSAKGDDCDSVAVITEATPDVTNPDMIPASPVVRPGSPAEGHKRSAVLEELMKKYPNFIPARLPAPRKRPKPVCRFVNFLGTRRPAMPQPTASPRVVSVTAAPASMSPTPYPTHAPASYARPDKRQKVSSAAGLPTHAPTGYPNHAVSALPTLGPSASACRAAY